MRRRKRRKMEKAEEEAKWAFIEANAEPERPAAEPAFTPMAAPRHDPVPASTLADAPSTDLPEDFDISRFGRHVQAAYRGPTEDNPSLSLKHRLRRASFFDQRERQAAEAVTRKQVAIPERGNWASRQDADFMFGRDKSKQTGQPALQD